MVLSRVCYDTVCCRIPCHALRRPFRDSRYRTILTVFFWQYLVMTNVPDIHCKCMHQFTPESVRRHHRCCLFFCSTQIALLNSLWRGHKQPHAPLYDDGGIQVGSLLVITAQIASRLYYVCLHHMKNHFVSLWILVFHFKCLYYNFIIRTSRNPILSRLSLSCFAEKLSWWQQFVYLFDVLICAYLLLLSTFQFWSLKLLHWYWIIVSATFCLPNVFTHLRYFPRTPLPYRSRNLITERLSSMVNDIFSFKLTMLW